MLSSQSTNLTIHPAKSIWEEPEKPSSSEESLNLVPREEAVETEQAETDQELSHHWVESPGELCFEFTMRTSTS